MDSLAFPIRFNNNQISKVIEGTDPYYNQFIATAIQVGPGELVLDVDFGVRDMTFGIPNPAGIKQSISFYFPEIYVEEVNTFKYQETSDYSVSVKYSY